MSEVRKAADELLEFALGFTEMTLSEGDVESSEPSLVGRELKGRYKLLRRLGGGSVGEVYEASVLAGGRPNVAIKVMKRQHLGRTDLVRRFRREARAAAMLAHVNVVKVFELAEDPKAELFFIVMELLEGETLADWLDRQQQPPPLRDVETIMLSVIDAFEAAHEAGIVHRDLKPDNLFLERGPASERVVKVLDFGLARVADPEDHGGTLTRPDAVGGTPEYMSPEQCKSLRVGPSADIYAMGCVLTELLQLRTPFEGGAPSEIMARQMFLPPPALKRPQGAEPIPPALDALRLDLLQKDPERRPKSVAEVRRRIEEAFHPRVEAPPREEDEPPLETAPESEHEAFATRIKRLLGGWKRE